MGEAIGQVLPFAVGVAISPLAIVAVVLMLLTPRARSNGPAFVVGWLIGLAVVGIVVLGIAGPIDASDDGQPATWVNWLKLVLGLLLLFVAALEQWRARPAADEVTPPPKWMDAIDTFTPVKAAGAGAFLSGLNPKNLLLTVGVCAAIAQTGASGADQTVAYVVFAVIATIGVAAPVVIFFVMGDRSRQVLDHLKARMQHGNAAIMAVLCVIIGAKLIGDAISGFSA